MQAINNYSCSTGVQVAAILTEGKQLTEGKVKMSPSGGPAFGCYCYSCEYISSFPNSDLDIGAGAPGQGPCSEYSVT